MQQRLVAHPVEPRHQEVRCHHYESLQTGQQQQQQRPETIVNTANAGPLFCAEGRVRKARTCTREKNRWHSLWFHRLRGSSHHDWDTPQHSVCESRWQEDITKAARPATHTHAPENKRNLIKCSQCKKKNRKVRSIMRVSIGSPRYACRHRREQIDAEPDWAVLVRRGSVICTGARASAGASARAARWLRLAFAATRFFHTCTKIRHRFLKESAVQYGAVQCS